MICEIAELAGRGHVSRQSQRAKLWAFKRFSGEPRTTERGERMGRFVGLLGILTMLILAYVFSTDRKAIRLKTVLWGLGLQLAFAFFVLRFEIGRLIFQKAGDGVNTVLGYAFVGSTFLFGELGKKYSAYGFIFAFQVLPAIIFIAAVFAFLYHIGVMQILIRAFAWVMTRVMGASGAESLDIAASIFMGQTEAPLTIRPFLSKLTKSELMCIMTCGMAHVSGGIMAAYIAVGVEPKHLLTAVIMTAPGTLLMAKMLVPETEQPLTGGRVQMPEMEKEANFLGAISRGTSDGLHLALNVGAMLISFIALLALANALMGGTHNWLAAHGIGWFPSSFQQIFGWIFAPVAWLLGIPWRDAPLIGNLLGTRMVLNEVVAFTQLGGMKGSMEPRSFTIATFALCGFANFSSIGIQIGGIGALAPEQRGQLAKFGIRAMLAGTMANLMSASIVGMLT
jgi:concentrative nucleoside transporter, CNT family